jgi:hypothetical protein
MMVAMDVESSMNIRRDRVVLVEVWGPLEDRGARGVEDVAEGDNSGTEMTASVGGQGSGGLLRRRRPRLNCACHAKKSQRGCREVTECSMLSRCGLYIASSLDPPAMLLLQRIPRIQLSTLRIYTPSIRALSTSPTLNKSPLPPRRVLLDSDLIENFLKGSGPGGQKINKTSSAVQLKHIPTGIVVKYQDTRSRSLNRKNARKILQDRLEELELGDDARTRVKGREKSKKKASSDKKKRRKYRALEGKEVGEGEDEEDNGAVEGAEDARVEEGHDGHTKPAQAEGVRKTEGG